MPKKKGCVKVATRAPRFREGTEFMRAHETMVDLIKANATGSLIDIFGAGIYGFLQNLELDEDRDLIYSDEDDYDSDQQNETQELKPHPRIKELDDKEADKQIKESIEEEEKRKSKAVKNKRKKMRKKEKKRQEREEGDKKVIPEEDQEKSSSSESEEEVNNYKELEKSTTDISDKPHNLETNNQVVKGENRGLLSTEKDDPPKNLDPKKSTPCAAESASKKTKNKSEKIEKTQSLQNTKVENVKAKQPKKEAKEEKSFEAEKETEENTSEIQKEKRDESKKETVNPIVDEYVKKSSEMAAIGNRLAANGQYEMAIKCFTEAIKFTPKEYKIFGNRSFCFEKMQQFEEALSDAEISLALEPNWTKGLFRKGKALCGLKKYYEATLAFTEVLKVENTSQEATMELKRAQTLHLMEMGFTWAQCTNALKRHSTLEEAIDALFTEELESSPQENGACKFDPPTANQSSVDDEWERVRLSTKPKQQTKEKVEPLYPPPKKNSKPGKLFPVWVGSLSSTVNYVTLQEVFNRVGKVFSIKMVLEHQCAFVNYTSKMDCERAVRLLNGMLLEGRPLSVRYPSRLPPGLGAARDAVTDPRTPPCVQKECFFWRTIGCTKGDCTYEHIPKNKGIDQEKFSVKSCN